MPVSRDTGTSVRRFHVGMSAQTLTQDAGYTTDSAPQFTTVAKFIRELGDEVSAIFTQVLLICDQQGLIGRLQPIPALTYLRRPSCFAGGVHIGLLRCTSNTRTGRHPPGRASQRRCQMPFERLGRAAGTPRLAQLYPQCGKRRQAPTGRHQPQAADPGRAQQHGNAEPRRHGVCEAAGARTGVGKAPAQSGAVQRANCSIPRQAAGRIHGKGDWHGQIQLLLRAQRPVQTK